MGQTKCYEPFTIFQEVPHVGKDGPSRKTRVYLTYYQCVTEGAELPFLGCEAQMGFLNRGNKDPSWGMKLAQGFRVEGTKTLPDE